METYGAVSTYQLLAGFAVDLEDSFWVSGTVCDLLLWRDKTGSFCLDVGDGDYLMDG